MNATRHQLVRIGALAVGVAFLVIASVPAFAQPVVYRITNLTGNLTAQPQVFPDPANFPGYPHNNPVTQQVATIIPNTGAPNSVAFPGGQLSFDAPAFVNPSPSTAFGVFFQADRYTNGDSPGLIGPNAAFTTSSRVANGWSSSPPFFTTSGPQGSAALQRVTPGSAKFGGAWHIGQVFSSSLVLTDGVGGFVAGNGVQPFNMGKSTTFANSQGLAGRFHATPSVTGAMFSSTVCPTDPGTCPWAGATVPWGFEETAARWTTGMHTGRHNNPPITFLPPVSTLTVTGADNRSGPLSSLGTLQLVSGNSSMGRGAIPAGGAVVHSMTISFLPEPGATAMLAGGFLGLLALRRRVNR